MYFATSHLPFRHRRDAWLDVIQSRCGTFEIDFGDRDFEGSIEAGNVGGFRCSRLMQTARTTTRPDRAGNVGLDRYLLIVQLVGQSIVSQDRTTSTLDIGGVTLLDADAPFSIGYRARNVQLSIHVPKSTPGLDVARWHQRRAAAFQARAARLVAALAGAAFEHGTADDRASAPYISDALLRLVSAGLYDAPDDGVAADMPEAASIIAVKRMIAKSIDEPALSPARIAAACGFSERQLHRTFEGSGETYSQFVRNIRLDRCAEELRDPRHRGTSLTTIAHSWGFSDSAHFSRAFRSRFGQPPRDYRAAALDCRRPQGRFRT